MLSSKLFSLLTFAAAAVAQGFPSGEFFIMNNASQLVFEVENGSSEVNVELTPSSFNR
jgi:hypothetical protein